MAISVVMPALELAQETGKLVAWRKHEGESIRKGEPLVEIETDKAVMEIDAPADGILAGVKVQVGAVVPVGETIAWIVAPGEDPPAESLRPQRQMPSEPAESAARKTPEQRDPSRGRVSPKARRLARELGIDPSSLPGSGPGRAVIARDILPSSAGSPKAGEIEALAPVARLMGQRTTQSWTEAPHFFLLREVEASALETARAILADARPSYTDLLIALVARVLLGHPRLNASWRGEGVCLHQEVNMGVAVAVKEGVISVVIPNAHAQSIQEIAVLRRDLVARARAGRLRQQDISGGTFTLTNLGMYDVDAFHPIINPPQAAILAVGRIADRVVPVSGQPAIRPMMHLTLACDHRVVDGAQAALFLRDVAEAVCQPEKWLK